jgi:hypothetical protein
MEKNIIKILEQFQNNEITINQAQKELLKLYGLMKTFIITYKLEDSVKELFWETKAKTDFEAVDLFWKTHDILSTIINVKEI